MLDTHLDINKKKEKVSFVICEFKELLQRCHYTFAWREEGI